MSSEVTFKTDSNGMGVYSKANMYAAIRDKCTDCTYDPLDKGSSRQQRHACTSSDCALHPYRLGMNSKKELGYDS